MNKTYQLSGSSAHSFADLAKIISEVKARPIPLMQVRDDEYVSQMIESGLPDFVAPFLLDWAKGINRGEWDEVTLDLEKLIARRPTSALEYFRSCK